MRLVRRQRTRAWPPGSRAGAFRDIDVALDAAAILHLGVRGEILLVLLDRALEVARAFEGAREVVEQDRLRIQRVGLPQQLGGVLEIARAIDLVTLAEQLESTRLIGGRVGLGHGPEHRYDDESAKETQHPVY